MPTTRRILGFVLLLATGPTWAGPVQIQAVRLASQAETTRVTLELSQSSEHKLFTLSNPHRVVVDIKPGRIVKQALPLPKGHGSVQRIRTANRQDGSVRVVLDLAAPVQPKSFLLNPDGQRGNRLVIDLRSVGVTASVKAAPVKTAPVKKAPLASRGAGRDIVIAIDPGHGGKDPGARGRNGAREKDVVLKISRQLAGKIDAEPGMRAIMTRHGDTFVHLRDRMERARSAEADLFISIHADAFRDRKVRGATVYVLSERGASDEASKRLAEHENAADLIGGVKLGDKDETLASVLMDLSQGASMSSSIDVGDEILSEIGRITIVRKRQVQQARFLVLKSPDVPSVLVETGFISNPYDEKNLQSSQYRQQLSRALFKGIRNYFYASPPADAWLAMSGNSGKRQATEYVIRRGDTLTDIANRYNVSVPTIRSVNHIRGDKIVVGRVLTIPPSHGI